MVPIIILGAAVNKDLREEKVNEILSRPGVQDVVKLSENIRKTQTITQQVANITNKPLPAVRNATSSVGR